jgi:ketosteroid isomerase-like protein
MTTENINSTEAILGHHMQALMSRDVDEIMKDYNSNSVLFSPLGAAIGLESIRANFTGIVGMLTPEVLGNMKLLKQDINGEYAYILWSAAPVVLNGGDTFHVQDGKIIAQSFVGQMGS